MGGGELKVKLKRTVKLSFSARFCPLHMPELRKLLLSIGNSSQQKLDWYAKFQVVWILLSEMARLALLKGI